MDSIDFNNLFSWERRKFFPRKFKEMVPQELFDCLVTGLGLTMMRVQANPRVAVPCFSIDSNSNGIIEHLVPVCLESGSSIPTIALSVVKVCENDQKFNGSENDNGGFLAGSIIPCSGCSSCRYEVSSVYSINRAYSRARVIQSVDQAWLIVRAFEELQIMENAKSRNSRNILNSPNGHSNYPPAPLPLAHQMHDPMTLGMEHLSLGGGGGGPAHGSRNAVGGGQRMQGGGMDVMNPHHPGSFVAPVSPQPYQMQGHHY
jgi:hypothetical protein